jgi:hypothetical protein
MMIWEGSLGLLSAAIQRLLVVRNICGPFKSLAGNFVCRKAIGYMSIFAC